MSGYSGCSTEAQRKARVRNWTIRRLRALYAQASGSDFGFTAGEVCRIENIVDAAIERLGGEPETKRRLQAKEARHNTAEYGAPNY